jgi:hypothetical protein
MNKLMIFISILGAIMIGCEKNNASIRVATFNIWEMSTEKLHTMDENGLGAGEQIVAAATIIKNIRPDIFVINEIDHDYAFADDLAKNARQFRDAYLNVGDAAIDFPHIYVAPCNTGIRAGFDFDDDGVTADETHVGSRLHGVDCYGYGAYPGQYSMALLSKFPIDEEAVRTFQKFLWKDLPTNHIPPGFYSDEELEIFRLSSKSHWDVPLNVNGTTLHLLMSHPTPPAFDGPEDRNGRRNFDEIKFWAHYLDNDAALYDDAGAKGGYTSNEPFIIAGDLNASPTAEENYDGSNAINQLLSRTDLIDPFAGMKETWNDEGKTAATVQFSRSDPMRIDYLLPSQNINVLNADVVWPSAEADSAGKELAEKASDHRMAWIDIVL